MTVIKGLISARSIEWYVDSLAVGEFPATAIVACLSRYDEAGPLLIGLITRAADDESIFDIDPDQFFNAIHIVAGARDTRAFAPLLRLLRRPEDEREPLLALADFTLPRIIISTFDGDHEALFEAILDPRIGDLNRSALLAAATYLAWDGHIERDRMVDFLRDFDAPDGSMETPHLWGAWAMAIAHLGLRELEQACRRAFEDGRVGDSVDEPYFGQILAQAEATPRDTGRFDTDDLGYIDNALDTLQRYFELYRMEKDEDEDEEEEDDEDDLWEEDPGPLRTIEVGGRRPGPFEIQGPVVNPMRNVGRNDPCPCGSGKKAKRCCLAA